MTPSKLDFDHLYFDEVIAGDIACERNRQDALRDMGKFPATLADDSFLSPSNKLAVISEEFGEIARVVCEGLCGMPTDADHLREELIQLAACCVAWVEALDREDQEPLSGPDSDFDIQACSSLSDLEHPLTTAPRRAYHEDSVPDSVDNLDQLIADFTD